LKREAKWAADYDNLGFATWYYGYLSVFLSALQNEDGHTRARISAAYQNLSLAELKPILPQVRQSILEKSPSGVMFDGGAQNNALKFFSDNLISEGIELIAFYIRTQKKHGSDSNTARLLALLRAVEYGMGSSRSLERKGSSRRRRLPLHPAH